jgi:hypothetical protein
MLTSLGSAMGPECGPSWLLGWAPTRKQRCASRWSWQSLRLINVAQIGARPIPQEPMVGLYVVFSNVYTF